MMIIGLTGGIGSGKTTVGKIFASLGAKVLSTDQINRELTSPKGLAYPQIINKFGLNITLENGELDKKAIRNRIFSNEYEKKWLEDLLHPMIKEKLLAEVEVIKNVEYCIVEIPLLIETSFIDIADRILVVDCDKQLQIDRVCLRDQSKPIQVELIINSQLSREERISYANDIILNDSSLTELSKKVDLLNKRYIKLTG